MTLGDRVACCGAACCSRWPPRELYEQPVTFRRGLHRSPPMNFLPDVHEASCRCRSSTWTFPGHRVAADRRRADGRRVRPEAFEDASMLDESSLGRTSRPDRRHEWLGNEKYAYVPFEPHPTSRPP